MRCCTNLSQLSLAVRVLLAIAGQCAALLQVNQQQRYSSCGNSGYAASTGQGIGARLTQLVPFSLLAPTQGLNITVVSYCGELHFGLAHDPDLLPDAWSLAEQIPKDFQRLQSAVDKQLAL